MKNQKKKIYENFVRGDTFKLKIKQLNLEIITISNDKFK